MLRQRHTAAQGHGTEITERERNFLTASGLDAPATPAMVRSAARIAALIVLFIAATIPFRSIVIGLLPGAYVVYGIALVAGYALSGLLLGWWSRRSSNPGVTVLSATYLFAAVMVLTNVILILEPNRPPAAAQASLWFWVLWHLGLPLGILASTVRRLPVGGGLAAPSLARGRRIRRRVRVRWFGSRHLILFENNPDDDGVLGGLRGRRHRRRACALASLGAASRAPSTSCSRWSS